MLNAIKTKFSIKDLENFTGIKSHTIRIWEKRYKLLEPSRTKTNIRYYDSTSFLKLLNINLLYTNGVKISKIAELSETDLFLKAKELIASKASEQGAMNSFKLAMLNFDSMLFNEAYNKLLSSKSFREIFSETFIPLLDAIGLLWQTKTITPVHEHFISNLITQKLHTNIERNLSNSYTDTDKIFVLYLPLNEVHELGILYVHYELTLRGYHVIYLGQNIAVEQVMDIKSVFKQIHFISYFTVEPPDSEIDLYLNEVYEKLLKGTKNTFYFLGRKASGYKVTANQTTIKAYETIDLLLNNL